MAALEHSTPVRSLIGRIPTNIIKWLSSIAQIGGYTATAFAWAPWHLVLFAIGLIGWFVVGLLWRDKAIMLIHATAMSVLVAGVVSG